MSDDPNFIDEVVSVATAYRISFQRARDVVLERRVATRAAAEAEDRAATASSAAADAGATGGGGGVPPRPASRPSPTAGHSLPFSAEPWGIEPALGRMMAGK